MKLSEVEYKNTIIGMIIVSFLILILFVGLLLYVYREPLVTGTIPKQKDTNNTHYEYNQYNDYNNPVNSNYNNDTDNSEYIDPENRKF